MRVYPAVVFLLLLFLGSSDVAARTILPEIPASIREKWTPAKDRTAGGVLLEVPHRDKLEIHPAWSLLDEALGSSSEGGESEGSTEDGFCFLVHGCWGGFNIKTQGEVSRLMSYLQAHHKNPLLTPTSEADIKKSKSNSIGKKMAFVVAAGDNFYKKGVNNELDLRFGTTFEKMYPSKAKGCTSENIAECPTNVPWLLALGNHDYRGNFTAQVHYTTLATRYQQQADQQQHKKQAAAVDQTPVAVAQNTNRWFLPFYYYAHSFGPIPEEGKNNNNNHHHAGNSDDDSSEAKRLLLLLVLDCPLLERCAVNPKGSPRCFDSNFQLTWIKHVLETEGPRHLFRTVVCHYPMYANGPHINYHWLHRDLQPLMEEHDVSIYYNADNHYMQISQVPHKTNAEVKNSGVRRQESILYVNSGGGGGYMPHTRKDKGYKKNPHSVFEEMAMGVTVQCISLSQKKSSLEVFDLPGFQEQIQKGGGTGSQVGVLKPRYSKIINAHGSKSDNNAGDKEPADAGENNEVPVAGPTPEPDEKIPTATTRKKNKIHPKTTREAADTPDDIQGDEGTQATRPHPLAVGNTNDDMHYVPRGGGGSDGKILVLLVAFVVLLFILLCNSKNPRVRRYLRRNI